MSVSVILPALNEEEGIEQTIDQIRDVENQFDLEEILVIDGDSDDRTREVAEEKGARVVVEKRKGYGRAYKTGFQEAKGDIYVTLDADTTYPARDIPELLEEFEESDKPFLNTNRDRSSMKWKSKIGNLGLNIWRRLTHPFAGIKDSQSGMWIMDSKVPEKLNLTSDGMPYSEEIKLKAEKVYGIEEVDIDYYSRVGDVKLNAIEDGIKNVKKYFSIKREDIIDEEGDKILAVNKFDWTHPEMGGAEVNLRETLTRMAEDHEVHLFTSMYPGADRREVLDGVHVHRFGRDDSTNEIWIHTLGQIYLNYFTWKLQPDNVLTVNSPFAWFIADDGGNRSVVFHHINGEVFYKSYGKLLGFASDMFERFSIWASRDKDVVSVSPATTEDLVDRGIPEENITEIRNGIDTEKYTPNGKWENPRVTYVGRLEKSKGVDRLPVIFEKIQEKFDDEFVLDIAGDGSEREMIREFADKNENVTYHGYVSEEKKQELLKKSWVNIVPSRREGWGLTVVEANASGTPVVAFRNGGLNYSVQEGETGQLVHNPHMEEFGEEVAKFLDDQEYRDEFSENARDFAEKRDWNQTTEEILDHLN